MAKKKAGKSERNLVAQNRKARHQYEILEALEAGIELWGTEVKSLRNGRASLEEAFAQIDRRQEIWLMNSHIPEYVAGSQFNHEPTRKRKLLLKKAEIIRLVTKLKEKGHTLVPLALYFKKGRAKVEIALVRGKRQYDKRQSIKKKEARREMQRASYRRR